MEALALLLMELRLVLGGLAEVVTELLRLLVVVVLVTEAHC